MANYTITVTKNLVTPYKAVVFGDEVLSYSFDFSPWAADHSTLTSATWSVKSGSANITNTTLSDNVASANIKVAEGEGALIRVSATDGTNTKVAFLDIKASDPFFLSTLMDHQLAQY